MTAAEPARSTIRTAVQATGLAPRAAAFMGTMLVIVALAVLPLLTPTFVHPALDASGSARRLSLEPWQAQSMSDRSIEALLMPMGSFAFSGPDGRPFYDSSEQDHLSDARILLWLFLTAGLVSALLIGLALSRSGRPGRTAIWRAVSHAGAGAVIVVIVLGAISLAAFGTLFTLFHQIFFPGGNWTFDPYSQRLVQLYPFGFWQIAAGAMGILVLVLGAATWLLGRWLAGRPS